MAIKTAGIGQIDRFRGALLGLAVGDAVGRILEFKSPGTFEPITDMIGGGPFRLKLGESPRRSLRFQSWRQCDFICTM